MGNSFICIFPRFVSALFTTCDVAVPVPKAQVPKAGVASDAHDFFHLPDMKLPDLNLQSIFGEYAKVIEQVWEKGPAMFGHYRKIAQDTWHTYTENHLKRFESLPPDDQRRFMNSGVDGAVVFLLLTTISRLILIRFLEPWLKLHFKPAPHNGFSLTYPQAKWLFSTTLLLAIWHANSHYFYDLGAPVDLALLLGVGTGLGAMIYRQSHSGKECLAFFALPVLILLPVSITIAVMQHGPFITQNRIFPLVMAAVTAATALFFIFEAPPTPVHKGGTVQPFGEALKQEVMHLISHWRHAPMNMASSVSPTNIGKKAGRAGSKVSDFVHNQEDQGREAIRVASPVVNSAVTSVYHFFENIFLFFLGLVYRFNKFLYYMYRLVVDGVVSGVKKIPGMGQYLQDHDVKGQHGQADTHGGAHHGGAAGHGSATAADHTAGDGQPTEEHEEGSKKKGKGRSRSGGRAKTNLSKRVSKSRSRSRNR